MPINYGPPANPQIAQELRPVRTALLRRIGRRRNLKRASLSAAAVAALSLGGVSVATGFDREADQVTAEFITKPQYVEQFAECMKALGWDPLWGSSDPEAPADVPAVHFTYPGSVNVEIGEDARACRAILSRQVGEPITPDF
ncbi:hypothetical protein [Zhihengliuella halotolerans]|uniref:hypothetical protein n=1 Tax=Zhihengliuella halotolerans TaxID=370736 RepID=UPI000C80F85F|nr:hypothetical protein [Zhihengliuella halotolerans]